MEQKLLAPNGRPSNLSRRLYDTVRTREFKNWFGDWENNPDRSSKVIDENGEPKIVYHGTSSFGFNEFSNAYDLPRNTENETNTLGFWFVDSKDVAKEFITGDNGGVYEVFINMKNPKIFKPAAFSDLEKKQLDDLLTGLESEKWRLGQNQSDMTSEKRQKYNDIKDEIEIIKNKIRLMQHTDSFHQFMNYRDKYAEYDLPSDIQHRYKKDKAGAWLEHYINTNKNEANKKLIHELQMERYDGILISDTVMDTPKDKSNQYIVFDPKDIKALDSHAFDHNSVNIHENIEEKTSSRMIYSKITNKENMEQTNKIEEGNDFTEARQKAIDAGESEFVVDGKTYKVTGNTEDEQKNPIDEDKEKEEDHEKNNSIQEMDTFNVTKRRLKSFSQFKSAAKKIEKKAPTTEHEIVADGYDGEKTGKKAVETLDVRKEKKGEHETVKSNYSGDKKGKPGRATLDGEQKKS